MTREVTLAATQFACGWEIEENLSKAERLVRDLANCELPFSCPHGRPTVINLSFQELEKRFGRKV